MNRGGPVIPEEAAKDNRYRILALLVIGGFNYWLAAIIATTFTIIATSLALMVAAIFETDAWELAWWVLRLFVEVIGLIDWGLTGLVALIGFGGIGTIVAIVQIWRHRHGVEPQLRKEVGEPVDHPERVQVENLLHGLAISADVPPPRFLIVNDPAPNSFALGTRPSNVLVGVTTGLLDKLTRDETEAVLAYQVSRVGSRDIALSTWTVALTGKTIAFWEYDDEEKPGTKQVLLTPSVAIAEWLRARALRDETRRRDMAAVQFTRHPRALLRALEKLERDGAVVRGVSRGTAPLWLEYPARPDTLTASRAARRFSTDEPLTERIALLRELVGDPPPLTPGA
jgi:heat shock protein HtpX